MSDWRSRAKPVGDYNPNWREKAKPVILPQTIQEMHPNISTIDRAIVKNFSQSPEKSLQYLKQKHPEMEFNIQQGEIVARSPGETDYRVLDPNTGFFSKDILDDAGDIIFDTGAGIVEGTAATAGAIAGAFASAPIGGVGALPGAAVAGAAASAGNEAIRQKIGQALGIPQEVDGTDVAISGAIGAASPLLFGAGNARGAIKTGWDGFKTHVAPRIGSMASGTSLEALKNYADDGIRATVDALDRTGISDYAGRAYDKITDYVGTNKNRAGEELVTAIDQTGRPVNIGPAKSAFKLEQSALEGQANKTNYDQARIDTIKRAYEKYFGLPTGERQKVGEYVVKGDPGFEGKVINRGSYTVPGQDGVKATAGSSVNLPAEKRLVEVMEKDPLTGQMVKRQKEITQNSMSVKTGSDRLTMNPKTGMPEVLPDVPATGPTYVGITENTGMRSNPKTGLYEKIPNRPGTSDAVIDIVDDPTQVFDWNTMTAKRAATEVPDQMTARRAWDLQKSLKQMAKFGTDMTPEEAYTKEIGRNSYGTINNALDEASDGLTTRAKGQYKDAVTLENELLPKFTGKTRDESIQKTFNELSNTDRNTRKVLKEKLGNLADSGHLDLSEEAKVLGTFRELGNPKLMPVSSGATTSTSRSIPLAGIGTLLGGVAGNQAGFTGQPGYDSALGAAGGMALGAAFGSPAMMKQIIRGNATGKNLKSFLDKTFYDKAAKILGTDNEVVRRGVRSGVWTEMMKEGMTGNEE